MRSMRRYGAWLRLQLGFLVALLAVWGAPTPVAAQQGTSVLVYCGGNGACGPSRPFEAFRREMVAAGATRVDDLFTLPASLTSYRVIFVMAPRETLGTTVIDRLVAFRDAGGRVIGVSEGTGYSANTSTVLNALSQAMGAGNAFTTANAYFGCVPVPSVAPADASLAAGQPSVVASLTAILEGGTPIYAGPDGAVVSEFGRFIAIADTNILDDACGDGEIPPTHPNERFFRNLWTWANPNSPPVANDNEFRGFEDVPLLGDVSINDTDPDLADGDRLSYRVLTEPANGTLTLNANGQFIFLGDPDWFGTTEWTYTVSDRLGLESTARVTIILDPVNDPPVARDNEFTVAEGATLEADVSVNDFDIDSDDLTWSLETAPTRGTLLFRADGTFRFDAGPTDRGETSFIYRLTDDEGLSATATVRILITGSNRPPAGADLSFSVNEDSIVSFSLTGTDPDGDAVTREIVTPPANGTILGFVPATGFGQYRPSPDYFGPDSFTYRVRDIFGLLSTTYTVSITVLPVNDPPVALPLFIETDEDTPVSGVFPGSDIDSAVLEYSIATPPATGTVLITNAATGAFTYTPVGRANSDTFQYRVSDGEFDATATVTVSIRITSRAPPTAASAAYSLDEDTSLVFLLAGTSTDDAPLTFRVVDSPSNGALTEFEPTTGRVRYTPAPDYFGADAFTFVANDGFNDSAPATISLTIRPVNDAPRVESFTVETDEDVPVAITLRGIDVDGDEILYRISVQPTHGTLRDFDALAGTVTYVPDPDWNGNDSFQYAAEDEFLLSENATVTVIVAPVNDPPRFVPPTPTTIVTSQDGSPVAYTIAVEDVDGPEPITLIQARGPDDATFNPATGAFAWTPTPYDFGFHEAIYEATDGLGARASHTVRIDVRWLDSDGDGIPDVVEIEIGTDPFSEDSDGDGIPDWVEVGPDWRNPLDTDGDGVIDALDLDSDGDGIPDAEEAGPDPTNPTDTSGDGIPDYRTPDSDGDGILDGVDNCRTVPNPDQADLDGDGVGDACDPDIDGDGIPNEIEIEIGLDPRNPDTDGDTILDGHEVGPNFEPIDTDGDGIIDALDLDSDGDGIPDSVEAGDDDLWTPPVDTDDDGIPDFQDPDSDGDGIPDATDNCRLVPNPDQADLDGDGVGDACDGDWDGDGVPNEEDNCPFVFNPEQTDSNGNGIGDACDSSTDRDGDGIPDFRDNCPDDFNPDQTDSDGDGQGDVCDDFIDLDGDGIDDRDDNCPGVYNPDQADSNGNGIGDACDTSSGGGGDAGHTADGGGTSDAGDCDAGDCDDFDPNDPRIRGQIAGAGCDCSATPSAPASRGAALLLFGALALLRRRRR